MVLQVAEISECFTCHHSRAGLRDCFTGVFIDHVSGKTYILSITD